jgi:hypothetical protein
MGRSQRQRKRVDYAKVIHKYDKYDFKPSTVKPKFKAVTGFAGRARAAPTLTTWPFQGMHQGLEYVDDITGQAWTLAALADDVKLPFAWLDPGPLKAKWQGLVQAVAMNGDAAARLHFNAVSAKLANANSNPTITEAVGEAAAAMAMLALGGWEMTWGFHLHAGTGIDQIWRRNLGNGSYAYRIVEAKGPGAGLSAGLFVPPGYAQMDAGWVINHLQSMNANGHAAGTEIVVALGLTFNVAFPNYLGATKSYHGLASASPAAANRLSGQVFTAQWQADGTLGWQASPVIAYL